MSTHPGDPAGTTDASAGRDAGHGSRGEQSALKMETVRYERRGHVAVLTLDRPHRLHAIDVVMARELPAAWAEIKADDRVRVAVVTASGERAFCTGFDMGDLAAGKVSADDPGPLKELRFTAIQNDCMKPVITAVNGMVCGGGLHFIADTDLLIASENASFFDSHVNVGTVAGLELIGLSRRMTLSAVLRMALIGRVERISASRAYELGLVGEVVSAARLVDRAIEIAIEIAKNSPTALARTKRILWESLDAGILSTLERAWPRLERHIGHPDTLEGAAAFAEKRDARWSAPSE